MKSFYTFLFASLFNVMLVSGAPTTGLQFSGVSTSYINCGQKSAFNPSQFTIEAWVNYQSTSGGYVISNEGHDATNGAHGFTIRTSGSKIEFVLGANAAWPSLLSTTDIPLNTWFHLAVTYSGSEMKLYVNGVENATKTITTPMVLSSQNLSIGEGSMWKDRRFTGKMGDLRFWNVVRTQSEISGVMSSSLVGTETGLVANWKMNEGTGTTIADATGNNTLTKPADVSWFVPSAEQEITVTSPAKGLVFDGTKANSFVDFGQPVALASPSEFTVEALVNYTTLSGGYILSSEGAPTGTTSQGFSLRLNGDKIDFTIGASTSWAGITAPTPAVLNTWYHVAATYSTAAMKLYINGLEVASLTSPAAIGTSTQNLIMGEGSMWKSRGLNGKLGYVRMWSVAKTKQEIRDNANVYVTGSEANLLVAWNNNIQGVSLADIKSTYPGTIGSDVTWFGFTNAVNSVYNNSTNIESAFYGSTVEVSNKTNCRLQFVIYSATGQKVMSDYVNAGSKLQKELRNLNGSYILKAVAEDGSTYTKKFILAN